MTGYHPRALHDGPFVMVRCHMPVTDKREEPLPPRGRRGSLIGKGSSNWPGEMAHLPQMAHPKNPVNLLKIVVAKSFELAQAALAWLWLQHLILDSTLNLGKAHQVD